MPHLVRRGAQALLLFWLVISLTFVLVRLAPGDAADMLVPAGGTAADVTRVRAALGLDASIGVQYVRWLGGVLHGDLGESFARREPVARVLGEAVPVSLWLGGVSLAITFLLGVGIGIVQASRPRSVIDRVLTAATVTVYAAPSFWLALLLVAVFTYGAARLGFPWWLRLPAFGMSDPAGTGASWRTAGDVVRHAVLPVAVLSVVGASGIARYARAQLLELRREDWARTARSAGVPRRRVIWRHVLRNAAPVFIVLLGLSLPGVVAGSVFVEGVFAWPGMGRALLGAIASRDYPVVMGAAVLYAGLVILANLVADLALPLVDPRRR